MDNKRLGQLLDAIIVNDMIITKARGKFNNAVTELKDNYDYIKANELSEELTSKINVVDNVLKEVMEENKRYNDEILGANSDRGRID